MKKGLGNILTLALSLINVILTAVLIFTFVPAINKTSKLVDKICDIVDLNVGGESETDDGTVGISDLDIVTVYFGDTETTDTVATLADNGYVKLSVNLNLNTKSEDYDTNKDSVDSAMSLIDAKILSVVSRYNKSTITQSALETDICSELNDLFGSSDFIYSVSISQYVVQ